jgi:hypothetical protein
VRFIFLWTTKDYEIVLKTGIEAISQWMNPLENPPKISGFGRKFPLSARTCSIGISFNLLQKLYPRLLNRTHIKHPF